MRRLADGGLEWTTPGGHIITTYPQPYGTDDLPPPAASPPPTERAGVVDDDPPPF